MGQLDQQRERIQDDLRGLVSGDVRCDDLFLQMYAGDASIYQIKPLGVVRPRAASDVAACVQYAAQKQISLHARGAGTGTAGASLGRGLILDFSKYFRRVKYTGEDRVRVQPGLVHERLNHHLQQSGRVFGPDPANSSVTTIGSVIAVDGAGSRWPKYGSAGQHLISLEVVLADGQVIEAGREPLADGASLDPNPRKRDLVTRLARLLGGAADLIRQKQPACPVNRCGYHLGDVLGNGYLDLARLVAGSEGTLALITEAVLATQPAPRHRGVTLLMFDSLDKASRAVMEILPHQPAACDLMDRRHLSLARETEVRFDVLIPAETEALLLVEMDGDRQAGVRERIHRLVDHVGPRRHLAFASRQAFDPAEVELFWQLAHKISPALYRMKGTTRPVQVVDDIAVPPAALADFLVRMQNVLKRHEVIASLYSHTGQGQLHIQPFLDLAAPEEIHRMQRLAEDLYAEVLEVGGTISGEHACGLSRTAFIRRQYGELYDLMVAVKQIFDPQNLFNPGKVIGDVPDLTTRDLRPVVSLPETSAAPHDVSADSSSGPSGLRNLIELQLNWDPGKVAETVRSCNGCGECRSQSPDVRMCPIFRTLPAEEASPRAKANLIRGVLTGQLELSSLTSDEFKGVADLCFNCHMCAVECPAKVDIPKLMLESKGAYVAANGLPLADWILMRLDLLGRLGGMISPLANWAIGNRQMRWLMEKSLGIAQGRKLPLVTSRSFIRRAARRRLTRPTRRSGHKVIYFVDTFANYYDPQLAKAFVAVLEHNGIAVYVPPEQKQAGVPAISCGALDFARRLAHHNVAILADAVRQGYHVVATEPAAALCLIREYPNLFDDEDARLVARNTSEACSYLWKIHTQGKLQLDLRPLNATLAYHMPCRLRAMNVGSPGEQLLRLIPGLTLQRIEEGCSGMAGTFGLKRENYRTSLRIGWGLISRLRDPNIQAGTTECSTCKMQMEQGTTKPTIHPLKLFALAYDLMPEAESLLTTQGRERIIT
jgi:FAD/FMN-containing dehydrogenase/Fe-S oxidoreductase